MSQTKDFFYDRLVLFLLTLNSFLTILTTLTVLLRLGNSSGVYVNSYRSNLGLGGIETGGVKEVVSFVLFAVIIFIFQIVLAIKFYKIRKVSAWAVMLLTTLLLILNLIVANSLLDIS